MNGQGEAIGVLCTGGPRSRWGAARITRAGRVRARTATDGQRGEAAYGGSHHRRISLQISYRRLTDGYAFIGGYWYVWLEYAWSLAPACMSRYDPEENPFVLMGTASLSEDWWPALYAGSALSGKPGP